MKRYLLFAYNQYYPGGGWSDFVADFDTEVESKEKAVELNDDYADIVDIETGELKAYEIIRRAESITLRPVK